MYSEYYDNNNKLRNNMESSKRLFSIYNGCNGNRIFSELKGGR